MSWTHSICDRCWSRRNPEREPIRVDGTGWRACCFCGRPTSAEISLRADPASTRCGGGAWHRAELPLTTSRGPAWERYDGRWTDALGDLEPEAVAAPTLTGWIWWAAGRMGDALTLEAAMTAADLTLSRLGGEGGGE